jgi:hypothetical protein
VWFASVEQSGDALADVLAGGGFDYPFGLEVEVDLQRARGCGAFVQESACRVQGG